MPKYYWKILVDHTGAGSSIDDSGVTGPRGCDTRLCANPAKFEMFDDDGELYYTGTIYGEYDGSEPLEDFGMPNAGCTRIDIDGETL